MNQQNEETSAMSAQQRRFRPEAKGAFTKYRQLVVGDSSWPFFVVYEAYSTLISRIGGLLGYALRRALLPFLLCNRSKALTIGSSVAIRNPRRVKIGRGVIIEDGAVLDVRQPEEGSDKEGITLGDNCFIGRNTILAAKGGQITLGKSANISTACRIATQSRLCIGDGVLVAAFAYIGPGNHTVGAAREPIIAQAMQSKGGVQIGDYAWIGTRATILDGVNIGAHAVVGAHSLVTEDVPENAIVAGTPAKLIRYREG